MNSLVKLLIEDGNRSVVDPGIFRGVLNQGRNKCKQNLSGVGCFRRLTWFKDGFFSCLLDGLRCDIFCAESAKIIQSIIVLIHETLGVTFLFMRQCCMQFKVVADLKMHYGRHCIYQWLVTSFECIKYCIIADMICTSGQ